MKADIVSAAKAQFALDQDAAIGTAIGSGYDGGFSEGVASVPGNPDVDAAVAAAVGPLNDQIAALNAQVASLFSADQVHQAVLDEDSKLAAKIKPILDELAAATAAAQP